MSGADLLAILPLLVLGGAAVVLMLAVALRRSLQLTLLLTLLALAAALACLAPAVGVAPRRVTGLLFVNGFGLLYVGLLISTSLAGALLAYGYAGKRGGQPEEAYILLLLATLGGSVLALSDHFASFFLGLELLSVSLYGLISYSRWRPPSLEAGAKYLVLAAVSSAFLLFGMALVYAELGTMSFAEIVPLAGQAGTIGILLPGLLLIVVGIAFKLAVVPFHMWTPDVYEGAPAPVTAFIATVSKGAVFALLLRLFGQIDLARYPALVFAFALIAVASMLGGNLLALLQYNVKRLLAYSSISHLGYVLVAFLAGGALGIPAATFYLVAYFATILVAFGAVGSLSDPARLRDADSLADYRGLFWRQPWLTVAFAASLLSLAGIPLTAGFFGKLYVSLAGISSPLWWLVVVLVVSSTIGLYYYLRVASIMFRRPTGRELTPAISWADGVVLAGLTGAIFFLGVYPSPLITLIQAALGLG
ncbi:MAG: NADH-quinone oxidoreductase subunit N [Chloroflexi bacterium]|nr:NADH-quinone oxidoreductase subunit N [Chloroflexota bacterium]